MKKIVNIEGMKCGHCTKAVEDALIKLDGVTKVKANLEKQNAVITMTDDVDEKLIIETVEAQGFKAGEITLKKGLFG